LSPTSPASDTQIVLRWVTFLPLRAIDIRQHDTATSDTTLRAMVSDMHPDEAEREPLTITVKRACELSGFGLTTIWKFIKEGRLKIRRVPGVDRTLILFSSLQELLTPGPSENTKLPPPRQPRGRPLKRARRGR
jgi:hypothetical protein